jgi:hypothetical protein
VDPLGENFSGFSSFSYVLGNPIILSDPTGMFPQELTYYVDGIKVETRLEQRVWNEEIELFQTKEKREKVIRAAFNLIQQTGAVDAEVMFRETYEKTNKISGYIARPKKKRLGGVLVELSERERNTIFLLKEIIISDPNSRFFIGDFRDSFGGGPVKLSGSLGPVVISDVGAWVQRDKVSKINEMFFHNRGSRKPIALEGGGMGSIKFGTTVGFYLTSGKSAGSPPTIYLAFPTEEDRDNFYYNAYYKGFWKGWEHLTKNYRK